MLSTNCKLEIRSRFLKFRTFYFLLNPVLFFDVYVVYLHSSKNKLKVNPVRQQKWNNFIFITQTKSAPTVVNNVVWNKY